MPNGTFVLADIGGYTTFLTRVGIEHAKEITSHLFNGMFKVDQDAWKVGNVEGDCLFLYSDSRESAEDVFSYLRRLYEKFRESIEEIAAGSTCRCGACDRCGDLTLKFVVHGGEFDTQEIAGRQELIGSDIVVAHRLLKNSVPMREYALVTTPLADVATASGLGITPGRDEYRDIGAVDYVYVDFQGVREAYEKSREIYLTEDEADVAVSIEIEASPDVVWSIMMDADKAPQWCPTLIKFETLSGTAEQVGSIHTCLHGDAGMMVHFRVAYDGSGRRFTDRLSNVPVVERMLQTGEARPSAAGTKFTIYYSIKPGVPMTDEQATSLVLDAVRERAENDLRGLKALCEAEARAT
jgi:Protein of unknown function (DUF2652)/Polyketide cyclase / dehydrase and lipid transport